MIQLFKDKKYWKEMGYILLFGVLINIACFCMPMVAHCENLSYPVETGYNSPLGAFTEQQILEMCNEYSAFPSEYYYIIRVTASPNSYYPLNARYDVCVFNKSIVTDNLSTFPLYAEVSNNGYFTFYLNSLYTNDNYNVKFYYLQSYLGNTSDLQLRGGAVNNLSANSPLIDEHTTYYFNISIPKDYVTNTEYVLKYTESINVGDFADLPPLDEILNNLTDTYTPDFSPVYPNIDNNKTDLENEKSFFDTLSQGITQNFNNLGANLQKFFNKIQEKLTNVGNAISTNIHNGFATLMQNIRDFFGTKLDKIIELLTRLVNDDEEDVKEVWESTQIYQDFDSISQFTSSGFAVWEDTSEPNSYKIPFHVEQIPLLHCDTVQYIDLGLFSPVIPYIRSIMWALMVYSVFYTVVDSLANYINGGDE